MTETMPENHFTNASHTSEDDVLLPPTQAIETKAKDPALSVIDRYGVWILAAFAFFIFFYQLGSYPLFDVDEPRYAEAAREMIEKKSWITPYFNYVIRLEKPVFFYWLLIASYKTFGVTEFAARFVSATMGTGLAAMTYALGRTLVSKRFGFWAAVILITSLEFIGLSRMSITDMTLASLMGGTFISLFLAVAKHPRWWIVGGIFSGLAILTKGPVGMVLPGSTLLLYSLITRQWNKAFFTPYFPAAIAIAIGIATPWYYLAWQENGQFFIDSLLQNNLSRFSGSIDYHSEPFYYYFIVLLVGFLPWTPFIPAGIRNSVLSWQAHSPLKQPLTPAQQLFWYSALWAVIVFSFFTAADTKLLTYILPMFPALSLWLAFAFENSMRAEGSEKLSGWLSKTAWSLFAILAVVGGVFITQGEKLLPKTATHISQNPDNLLACLTLLAGTLGFSLFLQKRRVASAFLTIGTAFSVLVIIALNGIVPVVNQATQGTLLSYMATVGESPLATFEITKPSLTFYTRRKIPQIQHDDNDLKTERDKLEAFLQSGCTLNPQADKKSKNRCQPVYVITKIRFMPELKANLPKQTKLRVVDENKTYNLVELSKP